MALPSQLSEMLQHELQAQLLGVQSVSGGDINDAYRLQTDRGLFFAKLNSATRYPGMFAVEKKGLELLAAAEAIRIPEPLFEGNDGESAWLVMEWLEGAAEGPDYWENFGRAIAKLHQQTAAAFGLDHANYIGSLPQSNGLHQSWPDFFIVERLESQIKIATDAGCLPRETRRHFDALYRRLEELFPTEPPALLHGDLWSGNFLTAPDGEACIIDPAVYYGHREMDIAMTKLFGGYNKIFYDAYNTIRPLAPGWQNRVEICNLYPLLVHLNLFGSSYLQSVQAIVNKF